MEFSRQEHWGGLPVPSPGDLPDPEIEPWSLQCRQILYCLSHQGNLFNPNIGIIFQTPFIPEWNKPVILYYIMNTSHNTMAFLGI